MRCVACGGASLVEGSLAESGGDGDVSFRFGGTPLLKRLVGMGSRPVKAYGCTHCGHLQLAVQFRDEDLERYQQFDEAGRRSVVDSPGEGG